MYVHTTGSGSFKLGLKESLELNHLIAGALNAAYYC